MIDVVQQSLFDYASLDADTRACVQVEEQFIYGRLKRTASDCIDIGQSLRRVQDKLRESNDGEDGLFLSWLKSRWPLSQRLAFSYMQWAERFGGMRIAEIAATSSVFIELLNSDETIIDMVEKGQILPTLPAIRDAKLPEKYVDPTSLPALKPEPGPIYGPVYQQPTPTDVYAPSIPTLHTPNTYEGGGIILPPVEIDRGTHDEYPLEEAKEKRDAHVMRVMGSSDSPEWYTPQDIVQLSIELLGEIDLDPCSNSHETPNVPATTLYTKEDDGLAQTWEGKVYFNPPYGSEIPQWVEKLVNSYGHGVTEAIALLPARIDTIWFQPLYKFPMCNVRGRIQYENSPYHAPFPCVIVYLGERVDDFVKTFKDRGPIMRRIG